MRTGAAELANRIRDLIAEGEWGEWRPDVIFATSLVSLGDLVAQLPRAWRSAVTVLYMHENQLVYPVQGGDASGDRDLQYPVTNLMSMLSADVVMFNSQWNRDSFLEGIGEVAGRSPESALKNVGSELRERCAVLWPPVELPDVEDVPAREPGRVLHNAPVVVWPHRWEHDKGPDELLRVARRVRDRMPLKWVLLGEQFREVPEPMRLFIDEFRDDIVHCGRIQDRAAYLEMLASCDWVLSTAAHEFFGMAVVEALWMGCLPWLPDRLSYPELIPERYAGLTPLEPPEDPLEVSEAVRDHLSPCRAESAVGRMEALISDAFKSFG